MPQDIDDLLKDPDVKQIEAMKIGDHIAVNQYYRDGGILFWFRRMDRAEFTISSVAGPDSSKVHTLFLKSRLGQPKQ